VKTREARRENGLAPQREEITYGKLVDEFLAQFDARSKAWKAEMLGYSTRRFGAVLVRDLRPDQASIWLHGLTLAPKTKKHILDSMRQVLTAGVEWGYLAVKSGAPVSRTWPEASRA
jgi:hypothetical protein